MDLYGKAKTSVMEKVILWHQKYLLPLTKVLGFVACRVISKVLGIGEAERSWGDVNKFSKMQNMIQILIIENRSTMLSTHYFLEHMKGKWL